MPTPRLGFAFTERDTPESRARLEADLSRIVATVARDDPRLVALILTGGFSRGEGTVRDGRPVNDYDLLAVRTQPGGDARYRALAERLTREVGLEVDLLPVWKARLPFASRKLFWLDARLGGRVIWGDERQLDRIRRFDAGDVPRSEAARLLGNRAAGLLLSIPTALDPQPLDQRDLQATKAAIAAMDATLLVKGRYASSLRGRLALTTEHPDHATFARAVEWKLRGERIDMGTGWWRECRDALLRAVEQTDARSVRDGLAEHAVAALRRAPQIQPSRRIRLLAWDLVSRADWPDPPTPEWHVEKPRFFAARARTLQ